MPGHCLVHVCLLYCMPVRLRNGYTRVCTQIMQHTHTHKAVTGCVEVKSYSPVKGNWTIHNINNLQSDKKISSSNTTTLKFFTKRYYTNSKYKVSFQPVNTGWGAHLPLETNGSDKIFCCVGLGPPPLQRACYLPSQYAFIHLG